MEEKQFDACMERMKSGDKDALHEIYEAYLGYIYAILRAIAAIHARCPFPPRYVSARRHNFIKNSLVTSSASSRFDTV